MVEGKSIAFSISISALDDPYDRFLIDGFVKIPTSYPHNPPRVHFKKGFPHINVDASGMHCG
jgi:ubiquitin-protein ligase